MVKHLPPMKTALPHSNTPRNMPRLVENRQHIAAVLAAMRIVG